ncbi:MAG: transporter substrate-binding domain-containing protein [Bauldia sp.]|nr:transporter substrate-binding domain-containing protein [Bauldia sp.]
MSASAKRLVDILTIFVVVGLFSLVYLLPPDTSLAEVRRTGVLRVCLPPDYPPLITGNPEAPGVEVELLQEIAARLELRLSFNVNSAIGSDFNPRNWRVTRAQCQIIAGGVVATNTTRSFLDTTPPHLETGWVLIGRDVPASLDGVTVGFFAGLSGRDRLALSRLLREAGATARVVSNRAEFIAGLREGTYAYGVTDGLLGRQIAGAEDWAIAWLSGPADRDPIAFGLWKGDLTLKRALVRILDDLRDEGVFDDLIERYDIAPIEATFGEAAP